MKPPTRSTNHASITASTPTTLVSVDFPLSSQPLETNPQRSSVAGDAWPPAPGRAWEAPIQCEGPAGQPGPQVSVSGWDWPPAARRHPGSRLWGVPCLFPCGLNYSCLPVHVPETMFSGCVWKPESLRFVWTGFYLRRRRVRLGWAEPGPASCAEVTTPWGPVTQLPAVPRSKFPVECFCPPWELPMGHGAWVGGWVGGGGLGDLAKTAVSLNHPQIPGNKKQRRLKGQRQTNHG